MFETSKDVLNLVIAAAVAVFTIFLCYLLYYIISMLRQANHTVTLIRERMESLGEMFESLKEKVGHSSNYLALLAKSVVSLLQYLQQRKEKKERKGKKD